MNIDLKLKTFCINIKIPKVKQRQENCTELKNFLQGETTVQWIEANPSLWEYVLDAILTAMKLDAEKVESDCRKNNKVFTYTTTLSSDLFGFYINLVTNQKAEIPVNDLIGFLTQNNTIRTCYQHVFLNLIKENLVGNSHFRKFLDLEDWTNLFSYLNSYFNPNTDLESQQNICLTLVIKWGPCYSFPVEKLVDIFDEIKRRFEFVDISSPIPLQISNLNLLNEFCSQTAFDNRMACCKLGEDIFPKILKLYENSKRNEEVKLVCIKFLLFQMLLHHPNSVNITNSAFYADNTTTWMKLVRNLYNILISDVKIMQTTSKHYLSYTKNDIEYFQPEFIELFVKVQHQVCFEPERKSDEPCLKRQKLENTFNELVLFAKSSKSWTWISLIGATLENYPALISNLNFNEFLHFMLDLLKNINRPDLTLENYIYKTLLALKNAENVGNDDVWAEIARIILRDSRCAPPNTFDELIHKLLNKLLNHFPKPESIFEQFFDRYTGINLKKSNLETIRLVFEQNSVLLNNSRLKQQIIRWILEERNIEKFHLKQTAEVLVNLVLRNWQSSHKVQENLHKNIEFVYNLLSLDELLVNYEFIDDNTLLKQSLCVDPNLLEFLTESLLNFRNFSNFKTNLNVTVLLVNTLCLFFDLNIIEEYDFAKNKLCKFCVELISNVINYISKTGLDIIDLQELNVLDLSLELLKPGNNRFICNKIVELMTEEFIRFYFKILQTEFDTPNEKDLKTKSALFLINYSLAGEQITKMQRFVWDALVENSFDFKKDSDFQMVINLLKTIIDNNPKNLPLEMMESILGLIKQVCSERYQCSISLTTILELLSDLIPIFHHNSDNFMEEFTSLLENFCLLIDNFRNNLIPLFKCIGVLYRVNPRCELIFKLPDFLCHNSVLVRLGAIKELFKLYNINAQTKTLEQYHFLEVMFSKIVFAAAKTFENYNNLTVDDISTRSATILHTFAAIMLNSSLLRGQALFAVMQIKEIQLEKIEKLINNISKLLNYSSKHEFLTEYIKLLFNQWDFNDYQQFPFRLYDCSTKIDFYVKYWHILAPLIVKHDLKSLKEISQLKSVVETVKIVTPQLITYCLAENNLDYKKSPIFILILKCLGEETLIQTIRFRIDEIMLYLVGFVTNELDFKKTFNEFIIFLKLNYFSLDLEQFNNCLKQLENLAFKNEKLMNYLLNKNPSKIHDIFVEIIVKTVKAQREEQKVEYFYHYTILVRILLDSLEEHQLHAEFFIKNLIYTLLHLIKDGKLQKFQLLACCFFKQIIDRILNNFIDIIRKYFIVIVRPIRKISKNTSQLSQICREILDNLFLIHGKSFLVEIKEIDPIPPEYRKLFDKSDENLLNKIIKFVECIEKTENIDDCEEELMSLNNSLKNKIELNELIKNKHPELIRLLCTLIKMSSSTNFEVNKQALKCIGAIGPCNFDKLILEPEKPIPDVNLTPVELLYSLSIVELTKYLVDSNVELIKFSTKSLQKLFEIKDARKLAENESDFGFGSVSPILLRPFFTQISKKFVIKINQKFLEKINKSELWLPKSDHNQWITELIRVLLTVFEENEFIISLIDIISIKVDFSEKLLPILIFIFLSCDLKSISKIFSEKIDEICDAHWNNTIPIGKDTLQTVLNIIEFIRLQNNSRVLKQADNLSINYLKAAKAAQSCDAHLHTILYSELWCQSTGCDLDSILNSIDKTTGKILQNLLKLSYKSVGEFDALFGCGSCYLSDEENRIEYFKEIGKWDKVVRYYLMRALEGERRFLQPLVDSLKNWDFLELPALFYPDDEILEQKYESLWRLGQWNYEIQKSPIGNFDSFKYEALQSLKNNDEFGYDKAIDGSCNCLIDELRTVKLITTRNFYKILTKIQSFKEIEEFVDDKVGNIDDCWNWDIDYNDHQYIEPIKTQRRIILTKLIDSNLYKDRLVDFMFDFAQSSRIEGNLLASSRILSSLEKFENLSNETHIKIKLEQARICWINKDIQSASAILKKVSLKEVDEKMRIIILKTTGEYLAESCLEDRQIIINSYFLESIRLLKNFENGTSKLLVESYAQLSKYVDGEYQKITEHMKSALFRQKIEYMKKAKSVLNRITVSDKTSDDQKKSILIQSKQCELDEEEFQEINQEKDLLLELALKYYILTLRHTDTHNISIFRLLSLLLENIEKPIVKSVLTNKLAKIPSYKFIPILPQLMPHIYSPEKDFVSEAIGSVIEICAKQHPHHTLPFVLSLAYANKDRDYIHSTKKVDNDERTRSAKKLLNKLKQNIDLFEIIERMELLTNALIELAYARLDSPKIPNTLKISKIKHFDNVLLPTCQLEINNDGNYNNIIGICGFGDCFENVGGINAPKKIICIGTDGLKRTQLIKGRDDLRQDAVMQQVFSVMNNLLSLKKETKKLRIRTYKIVPLSMRSGILEWVGNSITLGQYLTADGGAHTKYRPEDRSPNKCRSDFQRIAQYSNERKLEAYNKICENIKPVFHNFFLSSFPHVSEYFEKRWNYTRSVATSSMCGYILGIGDRHVNNILIDKHTAELIHIDFGIAFEQGQILPTPETIPFRLTRDIIDGMGVLGIEGVFRRSCEKTIEVFRLHHNIIMTILEVLLYDPLYKWKITLNEAKKRQQYEKNDTVGLNKSLSNCSSDLGRLTAERALLRLKCKLRGTDRGKVISIEHQVNTLIQQAIDPKNLCQLFHGWQPYL